LPLATSAIGKMAAPFNLLAGMVLSHATEDGAGSEAKAIGAKSLVDNLKSMLAKPKAKAA
jgi:pilus assembly protein CpaE